MRSVGRKLILAVDQGTTSTRCVAFNPKGQQIYASSQEFPQIYPRAGWVEHDPQDIFKSVLHCFSNLKLTPDDTVSGVGLTNQRETIIAWNRVTGDPLYNAVVWLDTRTETMARDEVSKDGRLKYAHVTGLPISTYFSALKIKWLMDNVPAVQEAVRQGLCCFGTVDSYLTYRLTGGRVFVTDCANASRYNLMDLRTLEWSTEICKELGIPVEALPRIVSNSETVGYVDPKVVPDLGGVPISALIGDQHAALLGHGCVLPGNTKITYGTGSFLLTNTGEDPIFSNDGLLTTISYRLGVDAEPTYALEGAVASAGRSVQWAKDNLRIGHDMQEFNEIAGSVEDTCGVTFVPAFSGLFAPYWRDDARAVIIGMSLKSNYRHIARAILEATAIQCAEVTNLLKADWKQNGAIRSIVTDGGMSKSDLLMQIQADLLGQEIRRARMAESTAFGAAYAAGLAVDFWPANTEIHELLGEYETFIPTMSEPEREAIFYRWKDAVTRSFDLSKFS